MTDIINLLDFAPSLLITAISTIILVKFIYSPNNHRKDFIFSFYLIATIVFFLVYALKSSQLELGMALGMFAIFGILRYRTNTIPIKEMTYIFLMIGLSVLNALKGDQDLIKAGVLNAFVVLIALVLEKLAHNKFTGNKTIIYDRVDLIKPQKKPELIEDLQERTGLSITDIQIEDIDYLKDTVVLKVTFKGEE